MNKFIFIVMAIAVTACKSSNPTPAADPHAGHAHASEAKAEHTNEIIFTPEQAKQVGLETEKVARAPFAAVIKTSGKLAAPQGDEAVVSAPCSGVIRFTRSSIAEGSQIGAGEAVATVTPNAISDGDVSIRVKAEYRSAKSEMERAERLIGDKIITQGQWEQARQRYEAAKSAFDALASAQGGSGIVARSPIGGYIKSLDVAQGAYVNVGEPIATITKTSRVQLRAEVSERHFGELSKVRSANFVLPYNNKVYKLDELGGRLVSVGKSQSNDSFYVPVIFEFDNRGDIVAGTYVEVYLLQAPKGSVISVPVAALTEEQGLHFVYVRLDAEGYQKKEVKLGQNNGDRVEIVSGLVEGDEVVTRGALQVKLAATSSVIPEGHNHNH